MKLGPWGKTIAVCAVIFLALAGFKGMQIRAGIAFAESFPERSESVESALVTTMPYVDTQTVLGEVVAPQRVALHSESTGRIVKVGFKSGDVVSKDLVLIQFDISEEEALLTAARANLVLAKSIYKRNENLFKSNAVSEEVFDKARVELANVNAEIARLKSIIRKKTIKAPFSGTTDIHQFEEGLVLQGNELITQLIGEKDYLWVDFYVPQFYPVLENGSIVEVQLLRATSGSRAKIWANAEVIARSTQVDKVNRSFLYRAKVSVADLPASVNSGVSVRISVSEERVLATVPATAVQQDHLGQFVFLLNVDKDNNGYRAERREVTVVAKKEGRVYVEGSLIENQLLAADGAFKLYPGLLVYSQPPIKNGAAVEMSSPESANKQAAL